MSQFSKLSTVTCGDLINHGAIILRLRQTHRILDPGTAFDPGCQELWIAKEAHFKLTRRRGAPSRDCKASGFLWESAEPCLQQSTFLCIFHIQRIALWSAGHAIGPNVKRRDDNDHPERQNTA
jgi:hypothetical protein